MQYAFIGSGNMGRSLARALIGQGVCTPGEILAIDPSEETLRQMEEFGCQTAAEADTTLGDVPVVVLAVKPQMAEEVCTRLAPLLTPHQVTVSIMAGVTLWHLQEWLAQKAVVRAMPNTPSQVGLGMNVYLPSEAVDENQLALVEALLKASGEILQVSREELIDAATAVSGSGPAYVFYFAEQWVHAAQELGFSSEEATLLVQQTLVGGTALWRSTNLAPQTLRAQVTSKGGTTAAACEHLDKQNVNQAFQDAIAKAFERARELAK